MGILIIMIVIMLIVIKNGYNDKKYSEKKIDTKIWSYSTEETKKSEMKETI